MDEKHEGIGQQFPCYGSEDIASCRPPRHFADAAEFQFAAYGVDGGEPGMSIWNSTKKKGWLR